MQHLSWAVCELRCEQCKDFFSLEGFVAWLAMQMFTSWKMKNCIPLHLEYYWYYVESGQDGFVSWIMDYTDYTTNYWNCPWTLIRLDTFNAPKPCTVQFSCHRQDYWQRSFGTILVVRETLCWACSPLDICISRRPPMQRANAKTTPQWSVSRPPVQSNAQLDRRHSTVS